jgi:hypothetical protein
VKNLEENFMTQNKFSALVEHTVQNNNGLINYIEAVASVCEEYEIEFEMVGKLISKPLKDKIKANAQHLNCIKRTSRGVLPL